MEYHLLPSELKFNILSRVPAGSLLQLRCVCKSWLALVDDPFFREIHTHRILNKPFPDSVNVTLFQKVRVLVQPKQFEFWLGEFCNQEEDDNEKENENEYSPCYKVSKSNTPPPPPGYDMRCYLLYLCSCNGLICLFLRNTVVFNPLTRECMYIPLFKNRAFVDAWGFGYHPDSKEYKVVRIFKTPAPARGERSIQHVYVYTVGSPKWRFAGEVPTCFNYCEAVDFPGVLVNGALHWFNVDGMIMSFDLLTEKFRFILPPLLFMGMSECGFGLANLSLGVLGNSLCVIKYQRYEYIEIWIMKNNDESWAKEFHIPIIKESLFQKETMMYQRCKFITVTKTGQVLFSFRGFLASYDLKKEKFSLHINKWLMDVVLHTNTFVSLKGFKRFQEIQVTENIGDNGIA